MWKKETRAELLLWDDEAWLDVQQAATLLAVHPNTIRMWARKGLLVHHRIGPRQDRRFRKADLDAFLARVFPKPEAAHAQAD